MGIGDRQLLVRHHSSKKNVKRFKMKTYLVISDGSEALVRDILPDSWETERSVPILFLSNNISTVWLHTMTEIMVWLNFFLGWLTMNAPCSVPWISSNDVLNSVNEILSSIILTLSKVLGLTEDIRGNSLLVLDSLLDNNGLWILLLMSLGMECEGSTIENSLFSITKSVICWLEFPVIVSLLLLTWSVVAMGLSVHRSGAWIISNEGSSNWIKHILGALKPLTWNTELNVLVLNMLWPFVLAAESVSEWLSIVRSVFAFFNIVEFIS